MNNEETYLAEWAEGKLSQTELIESFPDQDTDLLNRILTVSSKAKISAPTSLDWEVFNQHLKQKATQSSQKKTWPLLNIAAGLIGILLAATIYFNSAVTYQSENKILEVILPDQSKVTLMPGTELSFKKSFGIFGRTLTLKGEAVFKVEKGNPFTVEATMGRVEVLGTIFKVISSDESPFVVSCLEGKVKVDNEFVLVKNEHFNKSTGKIESLPWVSDFIVEDGVNYYQTPLEHLIQLFEKTHNIKILLNSQRSHVFTGVFPLANFDKGLEALSLPFKLNVVRLDEATYTLNE